MVDISGSDVGNFLGILYLSTQNVHVSEVTTTNFMNLGCLKNHYENTLTIHLNIIKYFNKLDCLFFF